MKIYIYIYIILIQSKFKMENNLTIHEIVPTDISNIDNIIIENPSKCSLNFEKIYEYKDVIAISLFYLFKQIL